MQTYISLLRGINVSGQKKILMADLKALYEELKFKNVITYVQSGNVIFQADSKTSAEDLAKKIEKKILSKYKFDVSVLVKTPKEFEKAIAGNLFIKEKGVDPERTYITFLAEVPEKSLVDKLKDVNYPPDRFVIKGKEIYLHCPVSYGNSKLNNNFFENKLKVVATTRNWKSVNALAGLAAN